MKLKVFGQDIKVIKKDLSSQNLHGYYCKKTMTIYLDKKEKGEAELGILLHELLHALFHRLGYNQVFEDGVEELLCENIPQLLIENFKCMPKSK